MQPLLLIFSDWAMLVLRVVLGVLFVVHGLPKLRNFSGTAADFSKMGFRPGKFFAAAAVAVEFFGGLFLVAGLFAQFAAFFAFVQFAILSGWNAKKRERFAGGWELDALIAAAALLLATQGAGRFSLDHFFFLGGL